MVVGIGRMFAGIRGGMVIAAGTTRYRFIKFIIADGLGGDRQRWLFHVHRIYWFGNNAEKMPRADLLLSECGFCFAAAVAVAVESRSLFIWRRMKETDEDFGRPEAVEGI